MKTRGCLGMEFSSVVKKRFMCRSYEDREVPDEALQHILDLAVRFPSAGHTQPQEFIVIRNRRTKLSLARAALGQSFVSEAPVVIVVICDTRRSRARYGERGVKFYSIVDGAFAALLVMLAAINEGLGAAFAGAFDDDEVRSVLGLPQAVRPIGIVAIGYCAERPQKFPRRSREEVIHYEQWREAADG
jgi:nitroreductase